MPKIGGRRKKQRTHKDPTENEERVEDGVPKSFVIKRGKTSNLIKQMVADQREIMYPYTSINLRENDRTKMKEYIDSCKVFGMSHLQIFTSTEKHNYMRFLKTPEGPTLTFKVISYCTRKDVMQSQARKKTFSRNFKPPVLVMSGFNKSVEASNIRNPPSSEQIKVVGQMFQSMFPVLNIQKAKIHNIQRVVLFQYDNEKDVISMRHYHISLVPVSSNKIMQKILRGNKTPNLRDYADFNQFINKNKKKTGDGNQSANESEADDIPDGEIELDRKSFKKQFTTRLVEIGPRLKLRLYKIEEGVLKGNVIYNRMVQKDAAEIEAQRKNILKLRAEKEKRRKQQEENVKRKKKEEKLKEKEKQKKQQEKQELMEEKISKKKQNKGEAGDMMFDEPDQEEINDEEGYFNKDSDDEDDEEQGQKEGEEEFEDAEYRGVDDDMQDFDDDFSEEESEQFIHDLEKQLRELQADNKKRNQQEINEDEEEEEEEDEGEDDGEEGDEYDDVD